MWDWVLGVIGVLAVPPLVLGGVGMFLPKRHRATRRASFGQRPERVWDVITDFANVGKWRKEVKSMERIADRNGHPVWVETSRHGRIPYEVTSLDTHRRMVTKIADGKLPFGGTWTYEISPTESGCTLRITEDGEIYNPFFRTMARFVFGYHATMEGYLKSLGKHLGEDVRLEAEGS